LHHHGPACLRPATLQPPNRARSLCDGHSSRCRAYCSPTAVLPPRSRRPHPLYPRRVPTSVSLPCPRMDSVITVPPPQISCTPTHGPSPRRAPAHGSRPHLRSDTSPAVSLPTDPSNQDSSDVHVSCPRLSPLVPLPERRLHLQPVVPRREGEADDGSADLEVIEDQDLLGLAPSAWPSARCRCPSRATGR
jgi:hypothetical protein